MLAAQTLCRGILSEIEMLQQLGTRAVGGGGGLLQHVSEDVASLVHSNGGRHRHWSC